MPVCPVCKRAFDERLQVFVPPRTDAFDTIDCALRATRGSGISETEFPVESPLLHIEMRPPLSLLDAGPLLGDRPPPRRAPAAAGLAAVLAKVIGAPGAAAAGLSLLGAGTAASLYLGWLSFGGESQTLSSRVAAPRLPSRPVPRRIVEPRPKLEVPSPKPKSEVSRPTPGRAASHTPPALGTAGIESEGLSSSSNVGPTRPSPSSSRPAPPRPAPAPPPPASSPQKPTPSSPQKPKAPEPGNSPGGGGKQPSPSKAASPPPSASPPAPPALPAPPAQPASLPENPSQPGNGYGDKNHDHSGPPGQEDDSGEDKGNRGKG